MKAIIRDAVAVIGLGCFAAGMYLQFGAGIALTSIGVLLLAAAATAARRGGA